MVRIENMIAGERQRRRQKYKNIRKATTSSACEEADTQTVDVDNNNAFDIFD